MDLEALLNDLAGTQAASVPPVASQRPQSMVPSSDDLASPMNDLAGGNQELNNMLEKRPPQRASMTVSSADLEALMNALMEVLLPGMGDLAIHSPSEPDLDALMNDLGRAPSLQQSMNDTDLEALMSDLGGPTAYLERVKE